MNLLGAALYDPAAAVSKATSSLLALTALDTTNLRVTVTVPAHGRIRFRLVCNIVGATTVPTIMLGVLNGATVVGRVVPMYEPATANAATQSFTCVADFTATGLAAGSTSFDASYAVQVVVAATNIKYGGPNNATGANAWGAFVFEVWDPSPNPTNFGLTSIDANGRLDIIKVAGTTQTAKDIGGAVPAVAAGASGGLLISGSNSGTTTLGALTVTGATTHTGNVVLSDGLTISAPSTTNRAGLDIAGNGTGAAIKATGGATGIGFSVIGGATSGDGIKVTTTSGHGINLAPVGTSMHGLFATGGNGGTSDGIKAAAGTGGVDLRANITGNLVGTVSTLTTYTGNTVQTGDSFARIGANGASLSAVPDTSGTTTLLSRLSAARAVNLDAISLRNGTAQAGAAGSITLDSGASATDSLYNGLWVVIESATGVGQARLITGYTGSSKVATVAPNWTTNPDATSVFALVPAAKISGVTLADTLTTYTGNTPQTGDAFARIGAAGAGLTALGDTRIANLDATVSSRMATYTQPTGFLAATFPASVASPTNITAGTITTVTNLTNAPTAGDLTATMKTSVTTAATAATPTAAAVTGAVGSVTGNVGGNVVGSVASVTAGVIVTTNNDKTGYGLSAAAVQAIWDALTSALTTVGSVGKLLVTNVDATISSRLATSGYTAPDNTSITAIKSKTDNLPAAPAAVADIPTANANADALLDRSAGIETGSTLRQAMRLMLAVIAGKASGLNTTTATYRDTNDTKNRITATVDTDGNRSAVTLDAS